MKASLIANYLAGSDEKSGGELDEIAVNYLYKDVLAFEGLRKSGVIAKLLQLLALQIGSEVSTAFSAFNLNKQR